MSPRSDTRWDGLFRCEQHAAGTHATIEEAESCIQGDTPAAPTTPLIYLPMDCPICGRHRVEWDGRVLRCEKCTTSSEWDGFTNERYAARSTPAEALDVDALGFTDLLDVAEAILHKYPPDSIVCSHSVRADRGALTTAAIADLIASCRLSPHNGEADSLSTDTREEHGDAD